MVPTLWPLVEGKSVLINRDPSAKWPKDFPLNSSGKDELTLKYFKPPKKKWFEEEAALLKPVKYLA